MTVKDWSVRLAPALLLALPLSWFSPALTAQETAALPYRVIYRQLQVLQDLDRLDKLFQSVRFASNSGDVAPTDIRLTIVDGSKTYEFTPDANGNVELPLRADWNEANLMLQTNQPRGSLSVRFSLAARPITATRLRYRDLMTIRRQFEQAFAGLAGSMGETAPPVAGLVIRFKPSATAGVVILAASGRQDHEADGEGVVRLPEDPALWAENPEVVLDSLPEAVAPWRK
jgi:hypothetical protein